MKKRRRPSQILFALVVLLGGVWMSLWVMQEQQRDVNKRVPLPDDEWVGLSLDQLKERLPRGWSSAPPSASDISMRRYAFYQPGTGFDGDRVGVQQLLRMRVEPSDVTGLRYPLLQQEGRRRPVNDLPPDWFPLVRSDEDPWRVPSWWSPGPEGWAVYHFAPAPESSFEGLYLHYDPSSKYLHLWQWKRQDVQPPESPLQHLVADLFAARLAQRLVLDGHPFDEEGWLDVPQADPAQCGLEPSLLPPDLTAVDALLLPRDGQHRYLMVFHGIDLELSKRIIAGVPMWELPADGAPPEAEWPFALPVVGGERRLPSWFSPGAGPRWAYALRSPVDGTVTAARWAAYDPERRRCFVWDWQDSQAKPGSVDPTQFAGDSR